MRFTLISITLLVATVGRGADDAVKGSGRIDGEKVRFPAKSMEEGVQAAVGLLESCHDAAMDPKLITVADLEKAREGDHIRLVFPKPIKVIVIGKPFEMSELVLTQPLNTGVFWIRVQGDRVVRCTKYEFQKEEPFREWRGQAKLDGCGPPDEPDR